MNQEQAKRLLDVARALREAPDPSQFWMGTYFHECGMPACAAGHYAARDDLHGGRVTIERAGFANVPKIDGGDWFAGCVDYFGITRTQVHELFETNGGCGLACTAAEAADYIEAFVARECPTP